MNEPSRFSHDFLIKSASTCAVLIALTLVVGKYAAWLYTGSLSVKASLIDSLLDALASAINFWAVRHAMRPPDACHRFGHEKVEALASLAQSIIIAGTALWLVWEVFQRLFEASPIHYSALAMWVMIGSTLLTAFLVWWQHYVVKHTKSLAIMADALHYKTDILTNMGVLVTILLSTLYNLALIDTLIGASIAAYILITSWQIGKAACDVLMDKELGAETRQTIIQIALQRPEVKGVHELRTRQAGPKKFIQLHLDLDENMILKDAHKIAESVEEDIIDHFPKAEVIIHQDPVQS